MSTEHKLSEVELAAAKVLEAQAATKDAAEAMAKAEAEAAKVAAEAQAAEDAANTKAAEDAAKAAEEAKAVADAAAKVAADAAAKVKAVADAKAAAEKAVADAKAAAEKELADAKAAAEKELAAAEKELADAKAAAEAEEEEEGTEIEVSPTELSDDEYEYEYVDEVLVIIDDRLKIVYNKAKSMVINRTLDLRQLTLMVPLLMQTAKDLKNTSGQQKKQVVHQALKHLVHEMDFEKDDQKELAAHFIENDLDDLIDTVYAASQGKFEFGKDQYEEKEVFDDAKFKLVYDNIKSLIEGNKIDIKTIIVLVPSTIASVAKFGKLTGHQRRLVVVRIFECLLDEYEPRDSTEDMVRLFIRDQLPLIIDTIYAAAKSKYVFKKVQGFFSKLASKCKCGCCGSSATD